MRAKTAFLVVLPVGIARVLMRHMVLLSVPMRRHCHNYLGNWNAMFQGQAEFGMWCGNFDNMFEPFLTLSQAVFSSITRSHALWNMLY